MNGLRWEPGAEIITCDLEHSRVLIPSYCQHHRHGAVVKALRMAPNENREALLGEDRIRYHGPNQNGVPQPC